MPTKVVYCAALMLMAVLSTRVFAQLVDKNKAPNVANEGISAPLMGFPYPSQIGDGRTGADPNASLNVIARDPFRAIRRGRQLFQRKFARTDGQGPGHGDGSGDLNVDLAIGAGMADSCAACHQISAERLGTPESFTGGTDGVSMAGPRGMPPNSLRTSASTESRRTSPAIVIVALFGA